jgi:hypothetical protein
MKVSLHEDWVSLASRREEWDELAERAGIEGVFGTYSWWDALRSAHFRGGTGRAPTLLLEEDSRLVAVWPLHLKTAFLAGILPSRRLHSGDWFMPHNGLICEANHERVALELLRFLRDGFRRWDALEIHHLIAGSPSHQALERAAKELGLTSEAEAARRSPYLALGRDWKAYLRGRSGNLRSSLKRNEKALQQWGEPKVDFLRTPEEVRRGFDSLLAIERQSWKEREGSSISARPWEEAFYASYIAQAASRGAVELALMSLEGRPVAYYLGVIQNGRYFLLKLSYVEELKSCGPGKLLASYVLRSHTERGLAEHDFLGEDDPWKMDWTDTVRPHVNLVIYRRRWYAAFLGGLRRLKRHPEPAPPPLDA